jgi:hypothetical protein
LQEHGVRVGMATEEDEHPRANSRVHLVVQGSHRVLSHIRSRLKYSVHTCGSRESVVDRAPDLLAQVKGPALERTAGHPHTPNLDIKEAVRPQARVQCRPHSPQLPLLHLLQAYLPLLRTPGDTRRETPRSDGQRKTAKASTFRPTIQAAGAVAWWYDGDGH